MPLESANFRRCNIPSIQITLYVWLVSFYLVGINQAFGAEPMRFQSIARCSDNFAVEKKDSVQVDLAATSSSISSCLRVPAELGSGKLVLAFGQIERNSADQFAELAQSLPQQSIVILQSLGGDLIGGLRLGQSFRARGFYTFIGNAEAFPEIDQKIQGKCYSACAYAFLGGEQRQVENLAQFGVHQFRGNANELNAVQTQKLSAIIGRYIDTMSVNRQLQDQALLTDPGKMLIIPQNLLKAWNIVTSAPSLPVSLSRWRLEATPEGRRLAFATQKQRASSATLTLAFAKAAENIKILLIVKPDAIQEGENDWPQSFLKKISLQILLPDLVDSSLSKVYELKPISEWQGAGPTNTAGTRQIWFIASADLMRDLQKQRDFYVKPIWLTLPRGLDDKTLFGTAALKDVLLAL